MTPIETKALETASKVTEGLLSRWFGPMFDHWGLRMNYNATPATIQNLARNVEKVKKIIEDNKVVLKGIDLKVAVPYLNGVCLEDNETLQNMWANLLVNYLDHSKALLETVYPNILSQLSTQNVKIINYMARNEGKLEMDPTENLDKVAKSIESLPNLLRLGIAEQIFVNQKLPPGVSRTPSINDLTLPDIRGNKPTSFKLTVFGWNFLSACSR